MLNKTQQSAQPRRKSTITRSMHAKYRWELREQVYYFLCIIKVGGADVYRD